MYTDAVFQKKITMVRLSWIATAVFSLLVSVHYVQTSNQIIQKALDEKYPVNSNLSQLVLKNMDTPKTVDAVVMKNGRQCRKSLRNLKLLRQIKTMETDSFKQATIMADMEEQNERKKQARKNMKRKKNKKNKKNKDKSTSRKKRFTLVGNEDNKWPEGIINYEFDAATTGAKEERTIRYIMRMFEYYTPLRFVNSNIGINLKFVQDLTPLRACWSHIGRTSIDPQPISSCAPSEVHCIHEFGHAIGFHHEHQHPEASQYLHANEMAINESMLLWFNPKNENNEDISLYEHGMDLDSAMAYDILAFSLSKTRLPSIILHEAEHTSTFGLAGERQTMHYMYKEINKLYSDSTNCSSLQCSFDGFSSLTNGLCVCQCPSGLESNTNCTSLEVESPADGANLIWPRNMALIQTLDDGGCPSHFSANNMIRFQGNVEVDYDNVYNFDAKILFEDNPSELRINFCVRDNTDEGDNEITLPKGAYCYIKDGDCQPDFTEGVKVFNNGNGYNSSGNVPSGISTSGSETSIAFCCRNDGHHSVPITFPTSKPFILFPAAERCQKVTGMQADSQRFQYYNWYDQSDNDTQDFIPKMNIGYWGNLVINLCYYTPKTTGCGGVYTLDPINNQVTFTTPNYPEHYDNGISCTWLVESPPGTNILLEFNDFDIAMNPDGTVNDELEIRNNKIGNVGLRYAGEGFENNIITEKNHLMVIFYSTKTITARGINATARIVDDTVKCYSGKGENYNGMRNRTKHFSPCLNWKDAHAKKCPDSPFAIGDEFSSLDHNFCRFPRHGHAPWCYVDLNDGCYREDCDPCDLLGCYDSDTNMCHVDLAKIRWCQNFGQGCNASCNCEVGDTNCTYTDTRTDCQAIIGDLDQFCDTKEGQKYCAKTCGVCDSMAAEPRSRTCNPPSVPDAVIIDAKTSYNLGEVARLRCNSSTIAKIHTQTCSTTGQWMPKLDSICGMAACPEGYYLIAEKCFKVINSTTFQEGKAQCQGEGGTVFTEKTDRRSLASALFAHFTYLNNFWLDLSDEESNDHFVWGDGTALSFTKWKSEPLVLPDECRQRHKFDVYSKRAITKNGHTCLYWNSAAVTSQTGNHLSSDDNYCRLFSNKEVDLYCFYNSSGTILKENCDHIPDCYDASSAYFPRNFTGSTATYTGHLPYAKSGLKSCLKWTDFLADHGYTDSDFPDATVADANNYCRNPTGSAAGLWCYTTAEGLKEFCSDILTCSTNLAECRMINWKYDGSEIIHYYGTMSSHQTSSGYNSNCKSWSSLAGESYYYTGWGLIDYTVYTDDSLFSHDGSSDNADNYCRTVYSSVPWCFDVNYPNPPFGYGNCVVPDCCAETGYKRASEYEGQRFYSWTGKKCLRWDSLSITFDEDAFPDGSIGDASNYCRDPEAYDYLYCYVNNTGTVVREWCDTPMDENIKDCAYYDQGTAKWIPTYCEDEHNVVCEIAGEDLGSCVDEDKEACLDLFTSHPEFCKDESLGLNNGRCKHMCGICRTENRLLINNDTCTEPALGTDVIKMTTNSFVFVGDYFEYECDVGKVAQGHLKRGCLPDGTLTGSNPTCIDEQNVDQWTTEEFSMKERAYQDVNNKVHFMTSKSNTIQKDGYIKGWSFLTETPGHLRLFVIRLYWPGYEWFLTVNYTDMFDVPAFRQVELDLDPVHQFPVVKGDHLGWMMVSEETSLGGIPYDTCSNNMFPDDVGDQHESASPYTDDIWWTYKSQDICSVQSLKAKVGPQD